MFSLADNSRIFRVDEIRDSWLLTFSLRFPCDAARYALLVVEIARRNAAYGALRSIAFFLCINLGTRACFFIFVGRESADLICRADSV